MLNVTSRYVDFDKHVSIIRGKSCAHKHTVLIHEEKKVMCIYREFTTNKGRKRKNIYILISYPIKLIIPHRFDEAIKYRACDGQLTLNLDEYRLACNLECVYMYIVEHVDLIERCRIIDIKLIM